MTCANKVRLLWAFCLLLGALTGCVLDRDARQSERRAKAERDLAILEKSQLQIPIVQQRIDRLQGVARSVVKLTRGNAYVVAWLTAVSKNETAIQKSIREIVVAQTGLDRSRIQVNLKRSEALETLPGES